MYESEWYESPVARNLRVTASRSCAGIAFRNEVSCLAIFGPIIFKIASNVEEGIRKKFRNPAPDRCSKLRRSSSSKIKSHKVSCAVFASG